jgi:hypothetical protein
MYEEDESNVLAELAGATGLGSAGSVGILAERARRRSNTTGETFQEAFKKIGGDLGSDIVNAKEVIFGQTSYDTDKKQARINLDEGKSFSEVPGSLREYSKNLPPVSPLSTMPRDGGRYVSNPITQAAISARDAFAPSSEDFLGLRREGRLDQGQSPEGPKSDTVIARVPLFDGVRDVLPQQLGGFNEAERELRARQGIDLMRGNSAQTLGGVVGRSASDFVNNGARSLWWLLNAPQAVVDVAAEGLTGMVNREGLYGLDYATQDQAQKLGWLNNDFQENSTSVNQVRYNPEDPKTDPQLRKKVEKLMKDGKIDQKIYSRRRVGNNLSTLLAAPAAVLINSGLGLNTFGGGSDGRKAVFPDEEDPTKTQNVLAEVASKYILGRQGDLLPWDEYKKIRPDVTKDEFMAYKGYRFNKQGDYNIFDDGDVNMFNGVIKTNDEGIDGAELMFLGRSMPIATTIVPTAAAIGGATLGAALAQHGGLNLDGIEGGIERRLTELDTLNKQIQDNPNESESKQKIRNDRIKRLENEVQRKGRMQQAMETGPMKSFFNNPRVRKGRVMTGGLFGGAAAGGLTGLVAGMIEDRRRAEKAAENGY